MHTRDLSERPKGGLRQRLRSEHSSLGATRRKLVGHLRRASLGGRRICLDRLRLSRRAHALQVAMYQLSFWHHGYLRLPQGQFLLLPGTVDGQTSSPSISTLELERQWWARD